MSYRLSVFMVRLVATRFVVPLSLAGCASNGMPFGSMPFGPNSISSNSGAQAASVLDRSIAGCAASIGGGLLVDLLGKEKKVGGGTVVGAVICGVILAVNNEEDKQRIRDSQQAALISGQSRTDQYVRTDGRMRTIKTTVTPAVAPARLVSTKAPGGERFVGPCRRVQTEITAQEQGTSPLNPEMVCRTDHGNWLPWTGTNLT
jgi:hypothetical protein